MGIIIALIVTLLYYAVGYYVALPALNVHSYGLTLFIMIGAGIFCGIAFIIEKEKAVAVSGIVLAALLLELIIGGLTGAKLFRSRTYASLFVPETVEFSDVITQSEEVSDIALMDTDTAKMFAERTLGELSELVSAYDMDTHCTTICYKGRPMKVAPLAYDTFFKYLANKESGIPGYVLIDPVNNTAKFVRAESPIYYSPSACFSKDLNRALRFYGPTKIYGESFFEIDDDDSMYWVTPVYTPQIGLFGGSVVTSVVIMDATTGQCSEYTMNEVPEWVDIVIDGDTISRYYNWYGELRNGFWNSVLAQTGCFRTTDDFGYKVIGEDVYIYTGVTSCNNSSSATGFVLANSRTGAMSFMTVTGAEEHSAMQAAEGEVSDYGWVASFPSIINVNGEPVYLMVLKDSNNIVKRYAMVNIKQYNVVAIAETQRKVLAKYNALINGEDEASAEAAAETMPELEVPETAVEKTVTVKEIQYIVVNGNTTVYVTTTDGVYRAQFDEKWILVHAGDSVAVTVSPAESGEIGQIYNIK